MKKTLIAAGICMLVMGTLQATAQQIPDLAVETHVANQDKQEQLRKFAVSLREQEKPLMEQVKVAMEQARGLKDQLKAMREEHKKAIEAKRAELGLPAMAVKPPEKK